MRKATLDTLYDLLDQYSCDESVKVESKVDQAVQTVLEHLLKQ